MRALFGVRDLVVAADAGLQRLRSTLRALLTVGAIIGVLGVLHAPLSAIFLGGMMALQSTMSAVSGRRARIFTTLALPVPMIAAVTTAAFADRVSTVATDIAFLIVIFLAVEARRFGPAGMTLGVTPVVGFFLTSFLGVTADQLGAIASGVVLAAVIAVFVREVVVPDAPRWTLQLTLEAFRAQRRAVARLALDEGTSQSRRLQDALTALNAVALRADDLLGGDDTGIAPTRRNAMRGAIAHAEIVVEQATRALDSASADRRERAREALGAILRRRPLEAAHLADELGATAPPRPKADRPLALPRPTGRTKYSPNLVAFQTTVAAAAAIEAGRAISPARWYWAVLAAFLVFAGTSSLGETLRKTWERIAGTALGVAAGIVLTFAAGNNHVVDTVGIVMMIAAALYFRLVSYTVFMFCLTVALGLAYGLLGRGSDELLVTRLEETAAGAFFGGLAATMLFPVRTRDVVARSADAYADAIRASVHASVAAIAGDPTEISPIDASRALDEKHHDLIARATPVLRGLLFVRTSRARRQAIIELMSSSFYARRLAQAAAAGVRGDPRTLHALLRDFDLAIGEFHGEQTADEVPERLPEGEGMVVRDLTTIAGILRRLAAVR